MGLMSLVLPCVHFDEASVAKSSHNWSFFMSKLDVHNKIVNAKCFDYTTVVLFSGNEEHA